MCCFDIERIGRIVQSSVSFFISSSVVSWYREVLQLIETPKQEQRENSSMMIEPARESVRRIVLNRLDRESIQIG
ncbi:hypothetical protein EPI10_002884 [Gossypium australe]|uniref:Uncharacterized protein n=1 Tax=Gossypium australe TaxID=47621 RepID=A0A5B6VFL6_9ROSI|nr:hypothetical protein EPI10_002884 [Gossypium australe]